MKTRVKMPRKRGYSVASRIPHFSSRMHRCGGRERGQALARVHKPRSTEYETLYTDDSSIGDKAAV